MGTNAAKPLLKVYAGSSATFIWAGFGHITSLLFSSQHAVWTLLLWLGQCFGVLGSICRVESLLKEAVGHEWVLIHKHDFYSHQYLHLQYKINSADMYSAILLFCCDPCYRIGNFFFSQPITCCYRVSVVTRKWFLYKI